MKLQNVFFATFFALVLFSCGKDDGPTVVANGAPTMSAQAFTAPEGISDTQAIGTVKATDPDGDDLAFAMVTNSGDLFEIAAKTGSLSLKEGKSLDFNTAQSHVITVGASDGEDEASAQITINVSDVNTAAPVMVDQQVSVDEDVDDATTIYAVTASDADGDALTFTIVESKNDLFEITEAGEISLANGKNLDFETATEHTIVVSVTDGVEAVTAEININVENVIDSLAEDPASSFITTWKIDVDGQEIRIATIFGETYDYEIDWGDGTVENIDTADTQIHEYANAGTYTVAIRGQFPAIRNSQISVDIRKRLLSIEQWGDIVWERFDQAFIQCVNMEYNATDVPDLSQVTNMAFMFLDCNEFNGDLSGWDVSGITNMASMFYNASSFNGDISGWETGNVTNMSAMFDGALSFDQDLGAWNISNVSNMEAMLNNSGMSPENYNATLDGWANINAPSNLKLGASGLLYCGEQAIFDRTYLIEVKSWMILDDAECE